jgi:hypothetical protein
VTQCPQCKVGTVVERRNKQNGQTFYGCSRYPECRFAVASLDRLTPQGADAIPATTVNADLVGVLQELTEAIAALTQKLAPSDQSAFSPSISQVPRP